MRSLSSFCSFPSSSLQHFLGLLLSLSSLPLLKILFSKSFLLLEGDLDLLDFRAHPCANVCLPGRNSLDFFNDGFALRPVHAACMRSPVSLYRTVISHQVVSCDLQFQYVQRRCHRKYVFTYPSSGHENNEATSVGFLFWSCTYYGGHCLLHVNSLSSSGSTSSWFFFCL